jgi:two-component system response regulator AtoC
VDQAADGLTALRLLEHGSYDVILSDLRMPGLDGEAFLAELRRRGSLAHIIFLTGDVSAAGERLGRAGVPILLKPVRLEEVARLVEETARG